MTGNVLQFQFGAQTFDFCEHLLAIATVHHGKQVVRPFRQHARTLVAQGHAGLRAQQPPQLLDALIWHVPYHHGIGGIAQFAMAHHHAQAADHTKINQPPQTLARFRLAQSCL